ncbi:hypothetical protein F7734_18555 [Scytonema sp. UIC 10036]|uniref:hypothetical protein n=1 Tax=Scytonema sp. UIC 10036 TaxID=2304196 RepID=UPI0012DAEBC8|nr:hypothetical protein [Scytonema sp. UIC 10036]MUG94274.1 hypothetical protein [Scytonema sp. UIC 10036]
MTSDANNPKFPLWQYLNQPVMNPKVKLVLDPRRFARHYRVELLERCFAKECDAKGSQQT